MILSKNFCLFDGKMTDEYQNVDIIASSLKHNRYLHLCWIVQNFIVQMFHDEV